MKKLRILLLGAAFSADLHIDGYMRIRDKVEIAAIVDLDGARIKNLADKYGVANYLVFDDYKKAIEEVECDMVDICLPNFLHYEPAVLALKKGRNIIVEKPIATKLEHAEEMVRVAKEMGRHIYYAEDWLFAPAVNKAMSIINSGGIGNLQYIRARECHSGSHSPFAQKIEYCGGGAMIHLGIHPICFVLAIKNNKWTELTAMTSGGGEDNIRHKAMEGEDWGAATIKFADGTTALVEANYLTCGGMEDVIDFYGDKGCLHVDLTFSSALNCFSVGGLSYTVEKAEVTTGWSRPAVDEKYNVGYVNEIKHFVESCLKDEEAGIGMRGEDGLEALRVLNYIYESARQGRVVKNI